MKRRDFLLFAGVTAIASKPATAEITRIGFIQSGSRQENQRLLDAFGENVGDQPAVAVAAQRVGALLGPAVENSNVVAVGPAERGEVLVADYRGDYLPCDFEIDTNTRTATH